MSSVAVVAVMGWVLPQVGFEKHRATWETEATPSPGTWQHDIRAIRKFPPPFDDREIVVQKQ
jgi:hypothetical protein